MHTNTLTVITSRGMRSHSHTWKNARAHTCFLCHSPEEKSMHQLRSEYRWVKVKWWLSGSVITRRPGGEMVEVGFGEAGGLRSEERARASRVMLPMLVLILIIWYVIKTQIQCKHFFCSINKRRFGKCLLPLCGSSFTNCAGLRC